MPITMDSGDEDEPLALHTPAKRLYVYNFLCDITLIKL